MGIALIGVPIAELFTSDKVDELKKQINDIIDQNQKIIDQIKQLQEELKQLDMNKLNEKLQLMNQGLTQNLRTLLGDQQLKLEMIKKIDPSRTKCDPQSMLQSILKVLNVVSTIFTAVEIICATNPVTIAISGVLFVLNSIINIFSLINDIKEIQALNEKKDELQKYFYGGKFQQDKTDIANLCFQMAQNFYLVVVNFNSMIHELSLNIHLYSLSAKSKNFDFKRYFDMIKQNPFDTRLQIYSMEVYGKLIEARGLSLDERIEMSYRVIDQLVRENNIPLALQKVIQIAQNFAADSEIGKELDAFSSHTKKLTTLKSRFQGAFSKRKHGTQVEWPKFDKDILQDLLDEARKVDEEKLSVAEVVSFFTTEFYGDDPSGKTLFGYNLQELYKNTELMNYLGANTKGQNVVFLPQPTNPTLSDQLGLKRKYLELQYQLNHPDSQFLFRQMYIRMKVDQMEHMEAGKSKLIFLLGLSVKNKTDGTEDVIEKPLADIRLPTEKIWRQSVPTVEVVEKPQRKEAEDENLDSLCKYLCFFINAIAYPDRVVNFNIAKVENKYKAVVEWQQSTARKELLWKKIKYSIDETNVMHEKETVLYADKVAGDNRSVVFSTK